MWASTNTPLRSQLSLRADRFGNAPWSDLQPSFILCRFLSLGYGHGVPALEVMNSRVPHKGILQNIAVSIIEVSRVSGSVPFISKSGAARVFAFLLTAELNWI